MRIREIVKRASDEPIVMVPSNMSLLRAADLLQSGEFGAVAVTDGDTLVGILSERAVIGALASNGVNIAEMIVEDAMVPAEITCEPDDDVGDILVRMDAANVHYVPVLCSGRPVAILTLRELISATCVLKTQAEVDDLTGLTNRRGFLPELERELESHLAGSQPIAVAMLDVDFLKKINDELGHAAGDAALREFARLLNRGTRPTDKAARIGGDEFVMLFLRTHLFEAVMACKRILNATLRASLSTAESRVRMSLSIGVTVAQKGDTPTSILARADRGLYQAKAAGGARVIAVRSPVLERLTGRVVGLRGCAAPDHPGLWRALDQSLAFSANN